jgi:nucleoside 2-deoxyribosyltransferase
MDNGTCPVCLTNGATLKNEGGGPKVVCMRCGKFQVFEFPFQMLEKVSPSQRAKISGWVRDNQGCQISSADLERLLDLPSLSVGQKAERLMLFLAGRFSKPGAFIDLGLFFSLERIDSESQASDAEGRAVGPELLAVAWAEDNAELLYLVEEYLQNELGYLERNAKEYHRITPKGWAAIDALRKASPESRIGFIAMWFDHSVDPAHLAIEAGIRSAGYEPLRIDRKEHNNKIDDEIVAGIRRSKFLVADFTGQRGGVYFEAGLAMGLGLPVVWLCRKDEVSQIHFDTRQYNCILWEPDKLADLSKALQNRIEATIGRGPLTASA